MTSHCEIMNGTYARHPSRRNTQFNGPQRVAFKALADLRDEKADAETSLIWRQDIRRVLSLLDTIPPRECLAIRMKFGIDCEPHTLEQIAELYGTTRTRPLQLINQGLRRLKFKLHVASQKDDPVAYAKMLKRRAADAKARAATEAERALAEEQRHKELREQLRREREAHEQWAKQPKLSGRARDELGRLRAKLELGNPSMVELKEYRSRGFVIFRDGQWITVYWHHQ